MELFKNLTQLLQNHPSSETFPDPSVPLQPNTDELRSAYVDFLENTKLQSKCILYESFGGRGMTCGPHAIFQYLLSQPGFWMYKHIWVIDDLADNEKLIASYRRYRNVSFIQYQSLEYLRYLASAKYLINNVSFPGYFTKRKEQVLIATWHGISLKTVGFDLPEGRITAGNTARNLLAADYLISANAYMTDVYKNAFRLDGLYEGSILQEGQPRNDRFFHADRSKIISRLKISGVSIDPDKKVILYAPTWKGSKYSRPDLSLDSYFAVIDAISQHMDSNSYQILVKPHQIVYHHLKETGKLTSQFIPATLDTNEILSVTDVLISDYSSIYFDFLVSGRPVFFFIPDYEELQSYRGLYFGIDKLPGPIARTCEQLGELIKDPHRSMEPYKEKYAREAQWSCPVDDGNVCARLTDDIFRKKGPGNTVRCSLDKTRLLIYAGDFSNKEVTHTFMGMAKLLDYGRFDVTVMTEGKLSGAAKQRIYSLPDQIRILHHNQPLNATEEERAACQEWMDSDEKKVPEALHNMFRREARRLFTGCSFDYAIEFTGKAKSVSAVFSHLENTKARKFKKSKSDLPPDMNREEAIHTERYHQAVYRRFLSLLK